MELLTYFSPLDKDKRWDLRREVADSLGFFFISCEGDELLISFGVRILACSPVLTFALVVDADGLIVPRLKSAYFCRVKLCPLCMYRRSLMWSARFLSGLPTLLRLHPHGRFLHLTLTVRNCSITDLDFTLDAMNLAYKRLARLADFTNVILGWVRATEVTRGKDGPLQAHPHFHVLLFVSSSYFHGKYYISHKKWVQLWRNAASLDYDPSVRVQTVWAKKRSDDNQNTFYNVPAGIDENTWGAAVSGANEVLKYAVAPLDLIARQDTTDTSNTNCNISDPWLVTCAHTLHHRRLVSTGGLLKTLVFNDADVDDLVGSGYQNATVVGEKTFSVPVAKRGQQRRYRSEV